jgi:hypothetical protein
MQNLSAQSASTALPLLIDTRGEAAVRHHVKNVGALLPEGVDVWEYVQAQARGIYDDLCRTVPGLHEFSGTNILTAPINNGVLHALPLVRGIGVVFLMAERGELRGESAQRHWSVAATFWLASSSVVLSMDEHGSLRNA